MADNTIPLLIFTIVITILFALSFFVIVCYLVVKHYIERFEHAEEIYEDFDRLYDKTVILLEDMQGLSKQLEDLKREEE